VRLLGFGRHSGSDLFNLGLDYLWIGPLNLVPVLGFEVKGAVVLVIVPVLRTKGALAFTFIALSQPALLATLEAA
jgi:hypothetical protein